MSQAEPFADRPGRAIEPARRSDLERSLGIDLSSVRLHTGDAAAQGAQAFGARAYTLGSDVFFAAGQYRPDTEAGRWLLAHELAHVAQSAALRGSNGQTAGATLRRSPEPGAGPAESPALGLPPPDCATRVNDVFVLGTVYENRAHPECSFAQIHERKNMSRVFSYRADLPLSATPCERGDVSSHEYWLGGDRWRILEVHGTEVLVMNACGEEEALSKSDAPLVPSAPQEPVPEHRIEVSESDLGPGTVDIFDACHRVVFTRKDGSPPIEYKWETRLVPNSEGKMGPQTLYYLQGKGTLQGIRTEYGPTELANLLRVRLLDIAGESEHCGELQPPRPPVSKEVPPDGLTP